MTSRINISMSEKDRIEILELRNKLRKVGIVINLSRLAVRGMKDGLFWLVHEEKERVKQQIENLELETELEKNKLGERLLTLARLYGGDTSERTEEDS